MTEIHYLILDHIEVPSDRARDFDPIWAESLAAIIAVQGLQHPIRVRPDGDGYRLIAGRGRLEAYRLLDRTNIPADHSASTRSDDDASTTAMLIVAGSVNDRTSDTISLSIFSSTIQAEAITHKYGSSTGFAPHQVEQVGRPSGPPA